MVERIADPVQMDVFSNRLLAIAEDMGIDPHPLVVLVEHQGAAGLLDCAVRRQRAG